MKEVKYKKVRERREALKYSGKDMVDKVNPLRIERGAKPITDKTYYKKETGEIPVYLEEALEFASVLGKSYKIFLN